MQTWCKHGAKNLQWFWAGCRMYTATLVHPVLIARSLRARRSQVRASPPTPIKNTGSVALSSELNDFPEMHRADQTGRIIPDSAKNWLANDIDSAPSIVNWPVRIMCISSMPAITKPCAERLEVEHGPGHLKRRGGPARRWC